METIVTIKGEPVIEIYESFDGSYWYITEELYKQDSIINGKVYKNDQILFGYARLSACPEYAEFGNISQTELKLLGLSVWKVPKQNWHLCPEVESKEIEAADRGANPGRLAEILYLLFDKMTFRPVPYLIDGQLDNTVDGKVTGWMRFAGLKNKVRFDLSGNFHRDIRGAKIYFNGHAKPNGPEAMHYMKNFSMVQAGSAGNIGAGLKPYDYCRGYSCIEWYNKQGRRVILELPCDRVSVIGTPLPSDQCEPVSQKEQNRHLMKYFRKNVKEFSKFLSNTRAASGGGCFTFNELKGGANKMDQTTQKKLDEYIELIEEIKERTESDVIAVGILHELCKDRKSNQFRGNRIIDGDSPATEKQIAYLRNLGADIPENVTKQQAAVLIDNIKSGKPEAQQTVKIKDYKF